MKLGTAIITKDGGKRGIRPEVLGDLEYVYSTCLEMIKIKTNNDGKTLSAKELLQVQNGFKMLKKYTESVLNKMIDNGIISDLRLERFKLVVEENEEAVQEGIEQQMAKNMENKKEDKLSIKQRLAKFLQDKGVLIKVPFVKRFIDRNLNVLPSHEEGDTRPMSEDRERFMREISNNGQYRGKTPQIQADIGRKVTQTRYSEHDENESR